MNTLRETFAVRLPQDLAREIRRRAAENDRTESQELRRLLRQALSPPQQAERPGPVRRPGGA